MKLKFDLHQPFSLREEAACFRLVSFIKDSPSYHEAGVSVSPGF
jgi:hypothetical protein